MEGDTTEDEEDKPVTQKKVYETKVFGEPLTKKDYRILITNPNLPEEALAILRDSCEIHVLPSVGDSRLLMRYAQGMDGILINNPFVKLDKEFFRGAGLGLKVVSIVGLSGDQIDVKEALKRKLKIGVCPSDVALDGAAEVGVGLALALCRRAKEGNNCLERGTARCDYADWLLGQDLKRCTCGILGLGKLGVSVAVRLLGFRPKSIVYYSRRVKSAGARMGIGRILLNELFKTSDLLFVCLPCNHKTRRMFNEGSLMKMKKNAILINLSHQDLVEINDLYCALRKGVILAAGMDVDVTDGPSPTHPIFRLDNFIMLPNIGRNSVIVKLRMNLLAARNLVTGLSDDKMLYDLKTSSDSYLVETEEEKIKREKEEAVLARQEEIRNLKLKEEENARKELERSHHRVQIGEHIRIEEKFDDSRTSERDDITDDDLSYNMNDE